MKALFRDLCALLLAGLLLGGCCLAETVAGDPEARLGRGQIEYEGRTYSQRRRLTTILLMGIDRRGDETASVGKYRNGGQADFLTLVVIDDDLKTVSLIQLNRDTMAEITVLNVLGQVSGTRTAQLCLAYAMGDGGALSCELMSEAVSRCLGGISVDHYAAMSLDGIGALNDALGGIEVTLEDDFSAYDESMTAGKTVRLTGEQAEYYLRQRYYIGDGSNISRLKRQRTYMEKAQAVVRERLKDSPSFINTLFDTVDDYLVTDMNRGRILNLSNKARSYEFGDVLQIDGQTVLGSSGYIEFYPDQDSVMDVVLNVFYEAAE